ncbi:MAG: AAA family ATPase, partial [Flavobacteriales bacterium]|nr:AAA family ATPase [Flavobacteriales bacterium]
MSHTLSPSDTHVQTEMAALAGRFVNSTNRNVFLTGKAGTGKTTFLQRLARHTHKRHVVLAPTGIAALNAGGVTIHSQFLLPFGSFVPERRLPADIPEYGAFHDRDTLTRRHALNGLRRNVLRGVDLLIIDEVSMLRADVLDAIDHRMRGLRDRSRPFGGVQVLFIGDLYQLPPVVKDHEWDVLRRWYPSMHFFESLALKESGYAHIELDKIFRQQDERFIRILNNFRENTVTADDVDALNAHYRPALTEADTQGVITLTTHNRTADEINQRALDKLPGEARAYGAVIEGDFPESMFPVLREVRLKTGAQVMFTRNDPDKMYFNGKLARVTAVDKDGVEVEMLDDGTGVTSGMKYRLKREVWENKRYVVDGATKEQKEQVLGTFEQYPVKLAWAITVHKSQGLTFDRAIIDVGQAFAPGQVYVALSRLRSLDGLMLRTRIAPHVVSTDRDVVAFSERRLTQQPLPEQLKEQQQRYVRAVLSETFDLGELQRRVDHVQKDHTVAGEFEDESMRTALARLQEKLRAEERNTAGFRGQLLGLLQRNDRDMLLERLRKGADYYSALLTEAMKDLLRHLAQVERLSRTKQYATALREIDGMLVKKATMIAKAAHIVTCILNDQEVDRRPDLDKVLADERHALVAQVQAWAEEHAPATTRKSGRTRKGGPGDGHADEWLDDEPRPRRRKRTADGPAEPKIKGETYLKTYAAIKEGKSLQEVANERSMALSTIEGHAARGIAEGVLGIDDLMPAEAHTAIADWMRENPAKGLNDARA